MKEGCRRLAGRGPDTDGALGEMVSFFCLRFRSVVSELRKEFFGLLEKGKRGVQAFPRLVRIELHPCVELAARRLPELVHFEVGVQERILRRDEEVYELC